MRVDPRRAATVLRDPGAARVVLLHGDDEGLVRMRADALTLAVAEAADDPFRVAWLSREDHDRLMEEASAIAMLGGRRVVRVREVTEALLPLVEQVLASPGDSVVVLESGALTKRSKLLGVVEAAAAGAAIACYPADARTLRDNIEGRLKAAGVLADAETLDWLRDHLGGDHASTQGELDKLILYAGDERRLDVDAARACVGDQAAGTLDEAVYAATLGDVTLADRSVARAFAEGLSSIGLLRGMLGHLVKLHQARGRMESGASAEAAVRALRPPIFWRREPDMVRSVSLWPLARVSAALAEVRRAELACKQTGAPDIVIARRLFSAFSRQAAAARR